MEQPIRPQSILQAAEDVVWNFRQILSGGLPGYVENWPRLRDEFGRFRLWTYNSGALAEDERLTLDYRLRDITDIHETILNNIEVISRRLKQVQKLTTLSASFGNQEQHPELDAQKEIRTSLDAVHDHVTWLLRLANCIRKASTYSEVDESKIHPSVQPSKDATANTSLAADGGKAFSEDDQDASQVRKMLTYRLQRDFPSLQHERYDEAAPYEGSGTVKSAEQDTTTEHDASWFFRRTVDTMLKRRGRILGRYQRYFSQGSSQPRHLRTLQPDASIEEPIPSLAHQQFDDDQRQRSKVIVRESHQVKGSPGLPSINASALRKQIGRSVKSTHKSGAAIWEDEDLIPLPPAVENSSEGECPYCCLIVSASVFQNRKSWAAHIKHDVEPYYCLFNPCPTPLILFKDRNSWLKHMEITHRTQWSCTLCADDIELTFDNPSLLESHLNDVHASETTPSLREFISEHGSSPILPLFECCPFCGPTIIHASLEDAIARHIEHIASLSLPCFDRDDDDNTQSVVSNWSALTDHASKGASTTTIPGFLGESSPLQPTDFPADGTEAPIDDIASQDWWIGFAGVKQHSWDLVLQQCGKSYTVDGPDIDQQLRDEKLKPFIKRSHDVTLTEVQMDLARISLVGYRPPDTKPDSFIPITELRGERFSSIEKIRQLLQSAYHSRPQYIPRNLWIWSPLIKKLHLKIFYILVSIAEIHYIHMFIDRDLDDRILPVELHIVSFLPAEVAKKFFRKQFQFDENRFVQSRSYHEHAILPLAEYSIVNDSISSQVGKAVVHGQYNDFSDRSETTVKDVFALKTHLNTSSEHSLLRTELKAYQTMKRSVQLSAGHEGIVSFYGFCIQNPYLHLVLEFAPFGDLESFMESSTPPPRKDEFWIAFLKLWDALASIHTFLSSELDYIDGSHGDIKPSNILLFGSSALDLTFKLSDFDCAKFEPRSTSLTRASQISEHSHSLLIGIGELINSIDTNVKTYSAPRAYDTTISTLQYLDTWALCCLCSVVATFLVLGPSGVREFDRARSHIIDGVMTDNFHDGSKVLDKVLEWHKKVTQAVHPDDSKTHSVLSLVEEAWAELCLHKQDSTLKICESFRSICDANMPLEESENFRSSTNHSWPLWQRRQHAFQTRGSTSNLIMRRSSIETLTNPLWHEEIVPTYRLAWSTLIRWLKNVFPDNIDEIAVQVKRIRRSRYIINIPRPLTRKEKADLLEMRHDEEEGYDNMD